MAMTELPASERSRRNLQPDLMIDLSRRMASDSYDAQKNPTGIVDLGSALNDLMLDEMESWAKRRAPLRSIRRRKRPKVPWEMASRPCWTHSHLNLADAGDIILLPTPTYGMFQHDTTARNGVRLVHVPCDDIPDARFGDVTTNLGPGSPTSELARRVSRTIEKEVVNGHTVSALILSNPENPMGRSYSKNVLREVAEVCSRAGVHVVVDEIYALTGGPSFSSALSLDLGHNIANNAHVLWGMSKDFGLVGSGIGFLFTDNSELYQAMRTCSMFTWVSSFSASFSAQLLSDQSFISDSFIPKLLKRLSWERQRMGEMLKRHGVQFHVPNAGFFIFINLSERASHFNDREKSCELALLEFLIDRRVFLEPGKAFFSQVPGWFRLNYGSEATQVGLNRLFSALQELDGDVKLENKRISDMEPSEKWEKFLCFS
ncbi:aminotransferase class I and II [Fusarium albosuccineum]|uniref:Aminotransferase class I and II n=1 Tax=Fusarium albosuccineum TaxID=1237068 RepID=A0A8H4PBW8_9HYPO|nr:aminotransferase class I and II [Fusarium albosuccineum]